MAIVTMFECDRCSRRMDGPGGRARPFDWATVQIQARGSSVLKYLLCEQCVPALRGLLKGE